jgi:aminocarboxymuconate-semialdehyde decarboxylase
MSASSPSLALYRCTCPSVAPGGAEHAPVSGAIDLHCHVMVAPVEGLVADRPEVAAMREAMLQAFGEASQRHNLQMAASIAPKLLDVAERLRDMDMHGVAVQVISPSPTQYYYWADIDLAGKLVALQNDHIAALCAAHPDRFLGLGAVALQHPDLAVAQLRDIMGRGFKGVEISTMIGPKDLADAAFEGFWAEAARLGAVVFIHPLGSPQGARLADHYLANIIGQPLETTIALAKLILGGVLERHPDLKLLAAHGGGFLPFCFGRAEHGYHVRPETRAATRAPPSAALRKIWYDSVVHDPLLLRHLIDIVGATQIVVGTDYPFDMGEYRLGALLDGVPLLSPEERQAILSGNARRLLGLPPP